MLCYQFFYFIVIYIMTEIKLYYANWCSHCVSFKPVWDNIKPIMQEHGVAVEEYEHTANKKLFEKDGVKSFPTIKINGENYQGDRSPEAILHAVGVDMTVQNGGGRHSNEYYRKKYLKYKKKYLDLRNGL
jgi:glutaredoxin